MKNGMFIQFQSTSSQNISLIAKGKEELHCGEAWQTASESGDPSGQVMVQREIAYYLAGSTENNAASLL